MNAISLDIERPAAAVNAAAYGREMWPLAFLADAMRNGATGALVTISAIAGGAPRPLGTHLAVLADGRHCGHISGGCVEAAIAAEVVPILAAGNDQVVRFGAGSCYIDIRFPCGGGVDLLVHVAPTAELLEQALAHARRRTPFAIAFDPAGSRSSLVAAGAATGWRGEVFVRRYLPRPRLVLVGRGPDFEVMARVAAAAEFELCIVTPDVGAAEVFTAQGVRTEVLTSPSQTVQTPIDAWTAVAVLFHEREWETALLADAASGPAYYVGALGSRRTHRARCDALAALGVPPDTIARIRGPIGLVEQARDPGTLALSVLSEIAGEWAAVERA